MMRMKPRLGFMSLVLAATLLAVPASAEMWRPGPSDTLQWILQGKVDTAAAASVYDIDGFDNKAATVKSLHHAGKHVICYIDVGTWENWRSDAGEFPDSVLGNDNGWPGERYLDIRQLSVLKPIMKARFEMCRDKGFDAIEPDNMDSYQAKTGFPLNWADERAYVDWLIGEAHKLHLSIGQKNLPEKAGALEAEMDWALLEECFFHKFCAKFEPYVTDGKAVFDTEYLNHTSATIFETTDCPAAASTYHYAMELKKLSLFRWRTDCSGQVTQ